MTSVQQMALGFLEIIEDQASEIVALRSVLAQEADEIPDWREQVETAKILCADRVHQAFASLRALSGEDQISDQPRSDPDSIVRQILDTLQGDQFGKD